MKLKKALTCLMVMPLVTIYSINLYAHHASPQCKKNLYPFKAQGEEDNSYKIKNDTKVDLIIKMEDSSAHMIENDKLKPGNSCIIDNIDFIEQPDGTFNTPRCYIICNPGQGVAEDDFYVNVLPPQSLGELPTLHKTIEFNHYNIHISGDYFTWRKETEWWNNCELCIAISQDNSCKKNI